MCKISKCVNSYNEVSDQKEKLYSSLGKTQENTNVNESTEVHSRKRWGLMNFEGSGLHYLIEVCDADCTTKANNTINRTEKNDKNILHILN